MKERHPLIMWSSRPKAALCKSAKSEDKRAVWSKCANFYENGSIASFSKDLYGILETNFAQGLPAQDC